MEKSKVIPKLRGDIVIKILENGNKKNLLLYDESKIATQPLVFPIEFSSLLQFFDGRTTIEQLEKIVSQNYQGDVKQFMQSFQYLIEDLDYLCYLETPYYFKIRDNFIAYMNSPIRPPICVGNSYPTDQNELKTYLENILSKSKSRESFSNINSIIAPHIDFAIGEPSHRVYSAAYDTIRNNSYDAFIILGTSHYGTSDYFMFTTKDFETPLGIAKTDKEFIADLSNSTPNGITIDEYAHRFEHSIEFQVLLLQYIFNNPEITIVPILVGSFHEFIFNNTFPIDNANIKEFLEKSRTIIFERYKNPLFVASVDFTHFGRKFHDPYDGMEHFQSIKEHDSKLIEHISKCNPNGFFQEVSKVKDKFKICGLSPIYTLLTLVRPSKGHFLMYDYWDDAQNKSVVTFASFCFEK